MPVAPPPANRAPVRNHSPARNSQGPKAASPATYARAKQGAAATSSSGPSAKPKAKASIVAKAAPVSGVAASNADKGDDDDDAAYGGVMTCANRDLLRQMMQAAEDPADDEDDDFEPASRIVPGTPQAGAQRRGVPTVATGPVVAVARRNLPTGRPVITGSSPATSSGYRGPLASASSPLDPVTLRPGSPPAIVAAVKASEQRSCDPVGKVTSVPVGQIATGPPARANVVAIEPRPGSRGSMTPASFSPVGPSSPHAVTVVTGPPTRGRTGASNNAAQGVGRAYANIHASKPKANSVPSPSAKAVAKPRCGPQAFEMLASVKPRCGPQAFEMLKQREGAEADLTAACGVATGAVDPHAFADEEDGGGFVMPRSEPGSDAEDEPVRGPSTETKVAPRPSATVAPARGGTAIGGSQPSPDEPQGEPVRETAAEYVERVQRGFVAQRDAPLNDATNLPPKASQPAAALRSRSSEPLSASGGGLIAAKAAHLTEEGSNIRARSNDHRVAVANARRSPPWPGDSDDSDDDVACSAPAKGIQWKADVKSMVQDFVRKDRTKGVVVVPEPDDRTAPPRRPPKAPANDALTAARKPALGAAEERRKSVQEEVKPGEELLFSKAPRHVEYTPATVESYKQKYANNAQPQNRSLGPDLDDDNLLRKKANQEKVKQFSKELAKVNHRRAAAAEPRQPEPKVEKPNARSKALEFAKNSVPKPKLAPSSKLIVDVQSAVATPPSVPVDADLEKIRALEERHFEDRERVERIQEYLAQVSC